MRKRIILAVVILIVLILLLRSMASYSRKNEADNHATVVEDTVLSEKLYSDNDIVITLDNLKGLETFEITIINNRDSDIFFNIDGVAVNHCMVYDIVSSNIVASGKKTVISYDIRGAQDYGITYVENIGVGISLNSADYSLNESALAFYQLNENTTFIYKEPTKRIYDDENCTAFISAQDNQFKNINAVYLNKTGQTISFYFIEASINSIMLEQQSILSYTYVFPNCYAYTGVSTGATTIYSSLAEEIKAKGLETVNELSGKLYVSGDQSYKTKVITVLFN